ncbi:MAG: acyl-CoA dehydrogenase family protein, partial [Pseudomonadota bacterium]
LASARTRAERIGDDNDAGTDGYRVNGEKSFLSAPLSDAFLVLAETPGGPSCFMMPRVLPDGEMNGIQFNRLKRTLGHRALAVVEAEFDDAQAWPVGAAGKARDILAETMALMRLDGALVSLGLMRSAVSEAIHHARQRRVAGAPLVSQPLVAQVLADMALHTEAATALTLRLARAFDQPDDEQERAWARLMTPVTSYWVCKSAPHLIAEAMECLGGNGFIEDFPLAALYRDAPAHAIWQGGGNMLALDVMRVLQRDPETVDSVLFELGDLASGTRLLEQSLGDVRDLLHNPRDIDVNLRALLDNLGSVAAACLMHAHAERPQADAYLASRLGIGPRVTYGSVRIEDAARIVAHTLQI